ncbi:hypothetical protein H7992_05155 [Sporosarcina sp. resist]|uniref:hypothetical protein n=1 Tax=Sporosarcina sp. resist TaxID=2762563 RepID=UPI00164E32D6|nr:hypothetical protein [Sporosarcina sp. resist]QNK89114.1 hypothetical protein H7992_05155 [Sporosarcina sp. resist]
MELNTLVKNTRIDHGKKIMKHLFIAVIALIGLIIIIKFGFVLIKLIPAIITIIFLFFCAIIVCYFVFKLFFYTFAFLLGIVSLFTFFALIFWISERFF